MVEQDIEPALVQPLVFAEFTIRWPDTGSASCLFSNDHKFFNICFNIYIISDYIFFNNYSTRKTIFLKFWKVFDFA